MTTSTFALPPPLPKKRIQRTRGQWKSLVEEFTTCGLTKVAFCKKRGISTSCFHRWQQVFAGHSAAGEFIDITEPIAAVTSPPPVERNADWQVELELGAGMVLRLRTR